MRLLVTRPQEDAQRTAAALRACGHDVLLAPMLRIESVTDIDLGAEAFGGVVMTSANAVAVLAGHARRAELQALPTFVVGRRTAEAAGAAGFRNVESADGNQDDLVALIRARHRAGVPLLYLAGEDRSGDLAGGLAPHGMTVRTVVAYRAVAAQAFAADIRDALLGRRLEGALHFSRRSAETFLHCARAGGILGAALALVHYGLSAPVAEPLRAAGAARVLVAPRPEEAALIEIIPSRKQ
jgi:uroporphyrinogen-III synthase